MAKLTVVLTSGGLDSAVAAGLAKQDGSLALLHLEYGQQAAAQEKAAFRALCEHFRSAQQKSVALGDWRELCDSPLLRPRGDIEDAATVGGKLAGSFVPMLSAAMLGAAAAWAYTLGAQRVVWGLSLSNPGNCPDRVDATRLLAWQLAARCLPEGRAPVIDAPLAQYRKAAVVELGRQLEIPLEVTWSCLRGGEHPCGQCIGCAARNAALRPARAGRG